MSNKADASELAEQDVERLIEICHKRGLNYWELLKIFLVACQDLQMKSEIEYYLNLSG